MSSAKPAMKAGSTKLTSSESLFLEGGGISKQTEECETFHWFFSTQVNNAEGLIPTIMFAEKMGMAAICMHHSWLRNSNEFFFQHMSSNLKRRETDFQKYSAIERENFRLLDRMSKIMVRDASHSIMGVHETQNNFPALNAVRSRERKAKQMVEENQTILKRIVNTKPYYSSMEWNRHAQNTYDYIGKMSAASSVSLLCAARDADRC